MDATTDEKVIIGWSKRWPNAHYGWALPVGLGLVDVDDPAAFAATGYDLPAGPEHRGTLTRPDGLHRLYAIADGAQTVRSIPGVDTRVGGVGWVALYSVDSFVGVPPPAPAWFPREARTNGTANGGDAIVVTDSPARAAIAAGHLFIPAGERDATLASYAGSLIAAGGSAQSAKLTFELLDAAGAIAQPPGDELKDFGRIAESVARTVAARAATAVADAPTTSIGCRTALDLRHGTAPPQLADPFLTSEGATVIYARGGTGKGMLACWLALRLVRAGHVVMVVDFEGHEREWGSRLRGLGATDTELAQIHYRAPFSPDWTAGTGALSKVASLIRDDADQLGVSYLVVDSYSVATSNGDTMGGEAAAREYFTALATIGLPSLTIAHVRGDSGKFPDRPFGSVFVHNLARETWAVEDVSDAPDEVEPDVICHKPHIVALELRNKKANARAMSGAQFVTFSFYGNGEIGVSTDAPGGRAVADLAADALADGPLTITSLRGAIKEDTGKAFADADLRRALTRDPQRFLRATAGRPRTWGLRR